MSGELGPRGRGLTGVLEPGQPGGQREGEGRADTGADPGAGCGTSRCRAALDERLGVDGGGHLGLARGRVDAVEEQRRGSLLESKETASSEMVNDFLTSDAPWLEAYWSAARYALVESGFGVDGECRSAAVCPESSSPTRVTATDRTSKQIRPSTSESQGESPEPAEHDAARIVSAKARAGGPHARSFDT